MPASVSEEQMEKGVSQDPFSPVPVKLYLEHIYADIFAKSGSDCMRLLSVISRLQFQLVGLVTGVRRSGMAGSQGMSPLTS